MTSADTDLVSKTDPEIWDLYRNGDQHAYNTLMRRYSKSLIVYGYRICQDRDFAKDCVQEVFLGLWKKREQINAVHAVKAYLFQCVRLRIFRDSALWKDNEELEDGNQFAIEFNIEMKLIEDAALRELSMKIRKKHNLSARYRRTHWK